MHVIADSKRAISISLIRSAPFSKSHILTYWSCARQMRRLSTVYRMSFVHRNHRKFNLLSRAGYINSRDYGC